jgi:hypothetical protein
MVVTTARGPDAVEEAEADVVDVVDVVPALGPDDPQAAARRPTAGIRARARRRRWWRSRLGVGVDAGVSVRKAMGRIPSGWTSR